MELNIMKCPKCGFNLTDNNYCVRCGYQKNLMNVKKYTENVSDLELYFKDSYSSILHGENNMKIFLLGFAYLSYRNNLLLGIIFGIFEFFSMFYFARFILRAGFGILTTFFAILYIIILRFLYMFFFDLIVLYIGKYRLKKIKKNIHYKEKLLIIKPNSIFKCIVSFLVLVCIITLFVAFY